MNNKEIIFYVNKINYIEGVENADLSYIPSISRRRMSKLDKITAAVLKGCISDDVENIVFASKTGEIERLLQIISQYKSENEVSPIVFSGSVHNFAAASFLLNERKSIPYTALSSGEQTLTFGFLSAIISKFSEVVFVYSDIQNDNYVSLGINISSHKKENSKMYKIKFIENTQEKPSIKDFYKLFSEDIFSVKTLNYKIERVL